MKILTFFLHCVSNLIFNCLISTAQEKWYMKQQSHLFLGLRELLTQVRIFIAAPPPTVLEFYAPAKMNWCKKSVPRISSSDLSKGVPYRSIKIELIWWFGSIFRLESGFAFLFFFILLKHFIFISIDEILGTLFCALVTTLNKRTTLQTEVFSMFWVGTFGDANWLRISAI